MSGAYIATNEIGDSSNISVSSENSSYPKENLYDLKAAKVFRCTSKTTLSITIDFGESVQADTIAIINHNFSSGATIVLKNGDDSPYSTIASIAYREHDIWKAFTAESAQVWVVSITDSNSDYLQIGQLLIGTKIALPNARRIGQNYSPARQREVVSGETYGGVITKYHLYDRLVLNPTFLISSSSDLAIFTGLDSETYGDVYPFVYIPDTADDDCFYVRKEKDFAPIEIDRIAGGEILHEYSMTLIESSRGLEILS